VVEHSGTLELPELHIGETPVVARIAVGQLVSLFMNML
jgi:hypothetical protein